MSNGFDIVKKDRNGKFEWVEMVSDFEVAKVRLTQLSAESSDEFVVFRQSDLQTVAKTQAKSDP